MQKLAQKNINVHLTTTIEEILGDVIMTVNKSGVRNEFFADTIVNATGYISNEELVNELKESTQVEVHSIGDGKQPGKIFDAIHAGYLLGRQI